MNEWRNAFCFHFRPAADAALRIASKNHGLLCRQIRPDERVATASHFARLSATGTSRRVAVFALSAATSTNPGQRSRSDHSSRRISSERSPAKAASARQGARLGDASRSSCDSSAAVKIAFFREPILSLSEREKGPQSPNEIIEAPMREPQCAEETRNVLRRKSR